MKKFVTILLVLIGSISFGQVNMDVIIESGDTIVHKDLIMLAPRLDTSSNVLTMEHFFEGGSTITAKYSLKNEAEVGESLVLLAENSTGNLVYIIISSNGKAIRVAAPDMSYVQYNGKGIIW